MKGLYEVPEYFSSIVDLMDDPSVSDEDFTAGLEMTARPPATAPDLNRLALSLAAIIRNSNSLAWQVRVEEERMRKRRQALENRVEAASSYLLYLMETAGVERVEDSRFRLKVTQNSPSVEVLDRSKIPDEFWRDDVIVEKSPNKPKILEAWKGGIQVEGTTVIRKKRVIIR